jgi:ABC-type antimicrobial peptide transport system permease subunit
MRRIRLMTRRVGLMLTGTIAMLGALATPALAHIVPESAYSHRVSAPVAGSDGSVAVPLLIAAAVVFAVIVIMALRATASGAQQRKGRELGPASLHVRAAAHRGRG